MALPRREDVPGESLSQAEALGNTPDADQGHFRVPKAR
jgi:Asp-tRNA(Asn)/Glu-tRNA(Gln) amidotransferase C subunit